MRNCFVKNKKFEAPPPPKKIPENFFSNNKFDNVLLIICRKTSFSIRKTDLSKID
jgi:hypothetical protein